MFQRFDFAPAGLIVVVLVVIAARFAFGLPDLSDYCEDGMKAGVCIRNWIGAAGPVIVAAVTAVFVYGQVEAAKRQNNIQEMLFVQSELKDLEALKLIVHAFYVHFSDKCHELGQMHALVADVTPPASHLKAYAASMEEVDNTVERFVNYISGSSHSTQTTIFVDRLDEAFKKARNSALFVDSIVNGMKADLGTADTDQLASVFHGWFTLCDLKPQIENGMRELGSATVMLLSLMHDMRDAIVAYQAQIDAVYRTVRQSRTKPPKSPTE